MDALAALVDEARQHAVGRGRFQQLDLALADGHEADACVFGGHVLHVDAGQAQYVPVEGQPLVQALDRYADMVDARDHFLTLLLMYLTMSRVDVPGPNTRATPCSCR